MSETDSDLDFQSADEDTESDINSQSTPEKSATAEKSSKIIESIEKSVEGSLSNLNKVGSANSESSRIKNAHSGEVESTDNKIEANEKLPCSTFSMEISKEIEESPSSSGSNIVENPKKEKQRVPLRLEKKIQQKTQLSKESSIEKCEVTKEDSTVSESNDNKSAKDNKEKSSWGFSSWGTSLLSTAASSVSTFSNQVSQGIGTVLETVESSLGAPSPEELASVLNENKGEKADIPDAEVIVENTSGSGILPGVASWTKVLENTGSKVIMGGLDTLELIGKKTIDILTEGDPGLRKKRTVFSNGISLSEILREAKEKADELGENITDEEGIIHYSQAFDDYQGLVHLEALEMLSKQAQVKLQRLFMRHSKDTEVKKRLEEIKSIFEDIPTYDDPSEFRSLSVFELEFKKYVLALSIPLNVDNIMMTQKRLEETIHKFEHMGEDNPFTPNDIFQSSICALAEFTARCIETFHKVAELILVQSNLGPEIEKWASDLTKLSNVMCEEVNTFASIYQRILDVSTMHFPNYINSRGLNITAMVTNVYVEASNSNKYIQDALQMLMPILQVFLLENLEQLYGGCIENIANLITFDPAASLTNLLPDLHFANKYFLAL